MASQGPFSGLPPGLTVARTDQLPIDVGWVSTGTPGVTSRVALSAVFAAMNAADISAAKGFAASSGTIVATGTTQGTANALTAENTVIIGGASGTGVRAAPLVGVERTIWNRSGSAKLIWPPSGAAFDGLGINAAATIANNTRVVVLFNTSTQGYVG